MSSSTTAVVVDDSHFMRSVISDILESGDITVIAQATNGREAIDAVHEHEPDVVTMDVEMPEMDGIEAVERIMAERPTPILMLSAHTDEDADVTFQALDNGAVDFFTKPGGEVSMEMSRLEDQLVDIVRSVAEVDVIDSAREPEFETESIASPPASVTAPSEATTVIIGSSTGGPQVVEGVLSELPRDAGLRVLIVQHMPEGFTGRFAERIDRESQYDVREASDGDRIGAGEGLVAPGDSHLVVSNYAGGRIRVKLSDDEPVNNVRPSVDVTMESASEVIDDPLVGVILTGMGSDGAAGIEAIAAAGGRCIAQDKASSAVFGMPKQAVETGLVDDIAPDEEVATAILRAVNSDDQ